MSIKDIVPFGVRYGDDGSLGLYWKGYTFTPANTAAVNSPGYGRLSGERDYGIDIGDGSGSSLIEACVSWISNAFTQAHPAVVRYKGPDRFGEYDRRHEAARLIRRPTYDVAMGRSFYSWIPLVQATVASFVVDGNAYWLKRRSLTDAVVQLWYVPPWMIEPMAESGNPAFIAYYRYRPGGSTFELPVRDVVHFRDGLDPDNVRKGVSKTKKLMRELYTDERAAHWTAALLQKHAIPGLILAPKEPLSNPEDANEVQRRLDTDFTGDNRGRSMVLRGPTEVTEYGFSPEQMQLGDIRDIPEERVAATLGIPAAVVGFGAGLQSTKVGATMAELVDLAWQNGVLPRMRLFGQELTEQLLPDFGETSEDVEIVFDTTQVPIMAEYHKSIAAKHEILMKSAVEMRSQAKRALGLPTTSDDDVYVVQAGVTFVKPDGSPLFEPPKPAPPAVSASTQMPMLASGMQSAAKSLTERQADIADMLHDGVVQKKIAADLNISERTVAREVAVIRRQQMADAVI